MKRPFLKKLVKNDLVSGSAFLFAGTMVANAGNYFYHLLMGRMLGPADYGVLVSLISLTYLLAIPNSTLTLVVTKYVSSFLGKGDRAAVSSFHSWLSRRVTRLIFAAALLLLFISPGISRFLHLDSPFLVFLVCLFGLIGFYTSINLSFLQGFLKFSWTSFLSVASAMIKLFLSLLLVFLGMRVFGAVLSIFLGGLLSLAVSLILVGRLLEKKKDGVEINLREILGYALPVFLSTLAFTSLYTTDLVLARHFLPVREAGFYASLSMLGKIIFFAASPLTMVMFPLVSNRFEKGEGHLKIFNLAFIFVFLASLAISLVYFIFPELMVNLLYGRQYLPAARYLPIFAVFLTFYSLSYLLVNFYLSIRKTKIVALPVLAALLQIIFIFLFHQRLSQLIWVSVAVLGLLLLSLLFYHWLNYVREE